MFQHELRWILSSTIWIYAIIRKINAQISTRSQFCDISPCEKHQNRQICSTIIKFINFPNYLTELVSGRLTTVTNIHSAYSLAAVLMELPFHAPALLYIRRFDWTLHEKSVCTFISLFLSISHFFGFYNALHRMFHVIKIPCIKCEHFSRLFERYFE